MLNRGGAGRRACRREGQVHAGIEIRFKGRGHRIDFPSLTGGQQITVYGQQEAVKDMIAARLAAGGTIHFEVERRRSPRYRWRQPAHHLSPATAPSRRSVCDFIAGCDGFHGICRPSIPEGVLAFFDRVYPFAWLGILSESAPASPELIYTHTDAASRCSRCARRPCSATTSRSRRTRTSAAGPTSGSGKTLQARTALADGGFRITEGPILQKGITPMRTLRHRADAVRPAVSRRRFGPHRAADRRQGHEPRGRRRALSARGARRLLPRRRRSACSPPIRRAACAGYGRRSASRGG